MLLARCGYEVLMVDRAPRGADTVSTHTLLRSGVLQMTRWGLLGALAESDTPPIRKVTLGFGSDLVPIDLSEDFGVDALYAPRRTFLDGLMQRSAEQAGVEYCDRTRAIELLHDGTGRVEGARLEVGSYSGAVRARYVVGADGAFSRVAKLVDARSYRYDEPKNAIRYAYYQGLDIDGVHFQFTPGVTAGLIPTNQNLVCVYLGLPAPEMRRIRSEADFLARVEGSHPAIRDHVQATSRVSPFRGTPGLPGFLRQPWGPGWALVGDAGYTKDPVSAHGMSNALRDAELCARALDVAMTSPQAGAEALTGYRETRDRVSRRMLDSTWRLAGYEWDARQASELMREVSASVKAECEMIDGLEPWVGTRPLELANT